VEAETHTSRDEDSVREIEKRKRSQEVSTVQKTYWTKNERQALRKRMAVCVGPVWPAELSLSLSP